MAVHTELPLPLVSKPKNGKLKREEKLFEPILTALKAKFDQLGDCYLEDTSKGNFPYSHFLERGFNGRKKE
jgi:hypothetical protein